MFAAYKVSAVLQDNVSVQRNLKLKLLFLFYL